MTLQFRVEKAADLRHRAFAPDPNDPANTVDSGKQVQELTLELLPDPLRGGKGILTVQIHNPDQIGQFKPGDLIQVSLTKVEG